MAASAEGLKKPPEPASTRGLSTKRRVPEAGPSRKTMIPREVSAMLESGTIAFVDAFAGVTIWRAVRKLIGRK